MRSDAERTEARARSRSAAQAEAQSANIPVVMIRPDLSNIPQFPLPEGFTWRYFRDGDEDLWVSIEAEVADFSGEEAARERFAWEHRPFRRELERRCLFLMAPGGRCAGTIMAWYNTPRTGGYYGRIHWVALRTEFQGRRLAKPLMTLAMNRMAELHGGAYLTTQTRSLRAIKVYLDFGFEPIIVRNTCHRAWRLAAEALDVPALQDYRTDDG